MSKQVHDEEEIARLRSVIGPRLRLARRAMGMTQEQAAKLIAISAEFYARVERGHALPSVPTLRKMATSLKVTVDHLLGHDTPSPRPSPTRSGAKDSRQVARIVDKCRDDPELRRLIVALLKLCDRSPATDDDDD